MDSWVNEANYRVGFKQLSTTQRLVHKGESETISRETNSIQFKSVKLQKATIHPVYITHTLHNMGTVHAGAYPIDHVGKWGVSGWWLGYPSQKHDIQLGSASHFYGLNPHDST